MPLQKRIKSYEDMEKQTKTAEYILPHIIKAYGE